jgi:hypothetical protein
MSNFLRWIAWITTLDVTCKRRKAFTDGQGAVLAIAAMIKIPSRDEILTPSYQEAIRKAVKTCIHIPQDSEALSEGTFIKSSLKSDIVKVIYTVSLVGQPNAISIRKRAANMERSDIQNEVRQQLKCVSCPCTDEVFVTVWNAATPGQAAHSKGDTVTILSTAQTKQECSEFIGQTVQIFECKDEKIIVQLGEQSQRSLSHHDVMQAYRLQCGDGDEPKLPDDFIVYRSDLVLPDGTTISLTSGKVQRLASDAEMAPRGRFRPLSMSWAIGPTLKIVWALTFITPFEMAITAVFAYSLTPFKSCSLDGSGAYHVSLYFWAFCLSIFHQFWEVWCFNHAAIPYIQVARQWRLFGKNVGFNIWFGVTMMVSFVGKVSDLLRTFFTATSFKCRNQPPEIELVFHQVMDKAEFVPRMFHLHFCTFVVVPWALVGLWCFYTACELTPHLKYCGCVKWDGVWLKFWRSWSFNRDCCNDEDGICPIGAWGGDESKNNLQLKVPKTVKQAIDDGNTGGFHFVSQLGDLMEDARENFYDPVSRATNPKLATGSVLFTLGDVCGMTTIQYMTPSHAFKRAEEDLQREIANSLANDNLSGKELADQLFLQHIESVLPRVRNRMLVAFFKSTVNVHIQISRFVLVLWARHWSHMASPAKIWKTKYIVQSLLSIVISILSWCFTMVSAASMCIACWDLLCRYKTREWWCQDHPRFGPQQLQWKNGLYAKMKRRLNRVMITSILNLLAILFMFHAVTVLIMAHFCEDRVWNLSWQIFQPQWPWPNFKRGCVNVSVVV